MSSNKLIGRDKIFVAIIFIYLAYVLFPMVKDLLPIPVGYVNIVVTIMILLLFPKSINNKTFRWFVVYIMVLGLYVEMGKNLPHLGIGDYDSRRLLIIEGAFITPSLAIWSVLKYRNEYQLYKIVTVISLFFVIIEILYLTPLVFRYDSLLRSTVEGNYDYHIIGIPRYALVHAYILISPVLLMLFFDSHRWVKMFFLLVLLLFTIVIVKSDVTTLILILSLNIILSILFYYNRNKVNLIAIGAIIGTGVFLLYETGALYSFFETIGEWSRGTLFSNKMFSMGEYYSGDYYAGNIVDDRNALHRQSWNQFTKNILTGDVPVGEHSSILDRLGGFGLLGFIPYISIIISFVKTERNSYSNIMANRFFILVIISIFILLYEKGIFGEEGWLFFLVICPSFFNLYNMRKTNQIV